MNAATAMAVLLFCLLLLADLPALLRERDRRALLVYLALGAVTLLYLVLYVRGMEIFSPIRSLSELIEGLGLSYANWQGHS